MQNSTSNGPEQGLAPQSLQGDLCLGVEARLQLSVSRDPYPVALRTELVLWYYLRASEAIKFPEFVLLVSLNIYLKMRKICFSFSDFSK